MRVLLQTLRGELSVPEACEQLQIGESRFHALRGQWLQEALELLEPRPLGRPPQAVDETHGPSRQEALEAENRRLRQQLAAADVRRELAEVLPHVVQTPAKAGKKGAPAQPPGKRRRRS